MTSRSRFLSLFAVLAAAAIAFSVPANASLGDNVSTVANDAVHLRTSVRVKQTANYSVHEMQAAGATVREYASPGGKVFAVSWQGQGRPNLQQLLGSYYTRIQQAIAADKAQHPGRHPISINQPDLVVQMGGHQRAFYGRAYIPNMMPSSVKATEIR